MENIINTTGILVLEHLSNYTEGEFRAICKNRGGFLKVIDFNTHENKRSMERPARLLEGYNKGALKAVEFRPTGGDFYFTVFALKGKQVLIDKEILKGLTVGVINNCFINTKLYSQDQYHAVNATNWASKAYVNN